MRSTRTLAVILALATLGACSLPTRVDDDALAVEARAPYLVLENTGSRTLYWAAFDGDATGEPLWLLCADPSCPGLPPGARDSIRYDALTGDGSKPDSAVVYWWYLAEESSGEYRIDRKRELRLRL